MSHIVHLIPYGMTKLPQFQLQECQACVAAELNSIAHASDGVLAFQIKAAAHNSSPIADEDFPVYLLQGNRLSCAITLAKSRLPEYFEQNPAALTTMSQRLQIETAATIFFEGKSISFVSIDKYLPEPGKPAQLPAQKQHGKAMAQTVLHELGHCMGLEVDDYYDDLMKPGFPGRKISDKPQPTLRFSEASRAKIIETLIQRQRSRRD